MRRARIKAVAALPPRRKNQEKTDTTTNKSESSKESAESNLKSPKTPRSYVNKNEEKHSPASKSPSAVLRTPPALLPISSPRPKTPLTTEKVSTPKGSDGSATPLTTEKVSTPKGSDESKTPLTTEKVSTPKCYDEPRNETPKLSEKVSVITSTSRINSTRSVFVPPQIRSPLVRQTTSPLLLSPKPVKNNEIPTEINEPSQKQTLDENGRTPLSEARENISNDYNIPSIPESITDDPVMDGIVPLKSKGVPKPSLMKDEIISDNAETLFDPIIPLPSPSKVRPKLRPVPRLGPHRRNSVQGSASESEDESRRALLGGAHTPGPPRQRHDSHTAHPLQSVPCRDANRIRNDSVCSNVSQPAAGQPAGQPPPSLSPVKEKHFSKVRRQEMVKRMWRRRQETVKREPLTMYDLIFYNPTTNPIVPDPDQVEAKTEKVNTEEKKEKENVNSGESEEDADDPPDTAAPVPQLKLGPNGEIMLDETSLVIKQSDAKRKISSEVREGAWTGGGGHYRRSARTADWNGAETVRFYRALAAVGTDFSLMAGLFPDRTRKDLKLKFKKEERQNGAQVDMALRSVTTWDVAALQAEFNEERETAKRRAEEHTRRMAEEKRAERERMRVARELRIRHSKGAKALESTTAMRGTLELTSAEDFLQRAAVERRITRNNRKKEKTLPPALEKPTPTYATITPIKENEVPIKPKTTPTKALPGLIDMATLSRVEESAQASPLLLNGALNVPSNIESGSLVVLRVMDPSSPSKTMLQTYIAHGEGKLVPVALPSALLSSVMGYMRGGTPKNTESAGSSPQLMSPHTPNSVADVRSATPSVIQVNPSPAKKQRHSSFTITNL